VAGVENSGHVLGLKKVRIMSINGFGDVLPILAPRVSQWTAHAVQNDLLKRAMPQSSNCLTALIARHPTFDLDGPEVAHVGCVGADKPAAGSCSS